MIRISAVIMAAGTSSRMGENKLLIKLGGKLVAEHLMSIYPPTSFSIRVLPFIQMNQSVVFFIMQDCRRFSTIRVTKSVRQSGLGLRLV